MSFGILQSFPDISKLEKGIDELKQLRWYQKPWGVFALGFISGILSSAVIATMFYFL